MAASMQAVAVADRGITSICIHSDTPGAADARCGRRGRPAPSGLRIAGLHQMRLLPCGPGAVLAEYDSLAEVMAVDDALRARGLAGRRRRHPGGPHRAGHVTTTSIAPPWSVCWCRVAVDAAAAGTDRRDPGRVRRRRSRRGRRRRPGLSIDEVIETHSSVDLLRSVPRLHPGLGLPRRSARRAAPATPIDAAHGDHRRFGRHRQRVHRRVPDDQPGRLAPARSHRRRRCSMSSATSRRWSMAGDRVRFVPHMIEIVNQGIGSSFQDLGRLGLHASRCRSQRRRRSSVAPLGQPPRRQRRVSRDHRDVWRAQRAASISRQWSRSPAHRA